MVMDCLPAQCRKTLIAVRGSLQTRGFSEKAN